MAKLGYTWYPKDWGNSESVFELNLSERGLYRELIDLAMLNDNDTDIKLDMWSRKFGIDIDALKSILGKLTVLNLIKVKGEKLFIPSCESRLNLVRGGGKGGKISKPPIKPTSKPFGSLDENNEKPTSKQIEKKRKEKKIEIFMDEKYQLPYEIINGEKIVGSDNARKMGGMSVHAIKIHCQNIGIEYGGEYGI